MHFSSFTILLSALVAPAVIVSAVPTTTTTSSPPATTSSGTVTATFSDFYDDPNSSLNIVACSNGANGLESKGFTTLGSLPNFPFVGGTHFVSGFNSPECGSCWQINFEGNSINMLAIDTSGSGFAPSGPAFQNLTNGQGAAKGTVEVTFEQLDPSACGL